MTRYHVTLLSREHRRQAQMIIEKAPSGSRVEVKAAKRTMPQNDKMWALLTEVALQVKWHGQMLRPDDWKEMFLAALKRELRMVPAIDGDGEIVLGRSSSSDLTIGEMSDLIELIHMFGANHGVVFADDAAPGAGIADAERQELARDESL